MEIYIQTFHFLGLSFKNIAYLDKWISIEPRADSEIFEGGGGSTVNFGFHSGPTFKVRYFYFFKSPSDSATGNHHLHSYSTLHSCDQELRRLTSSSSKKPLDLDTSGLSHKCWRFHVSICPDSEVMLDFLIKVKSQGEWSYLTLIPI